MAYLNESIDQFRFLKRSLFYNVKVAHSNHPDGHRSNPKNESFQPIAVNSKHLYSHSTLSYRSSMKRIPFFKCFFMIVTVLLQTGCLNTTVVNLTPPKVPRNAAGSYRFEAGWETNQRSIKEDSIEAYVVLGGVHHPMKKVPIAADRWEALIPLDQVAEGHSYHFKFDFIYNSHPEPQANSLRTEPFSVKIVEPNAR